MMRATQNSQMLHVYYYNSMNQKVVPTFSQADSQIKVVALLPVMLDSLPCFCAWLHQLCGFVKLS